MRSFGKLRVLFVISIFLAAFAGTRYSTINAYFSVCTETDEAHVMRAIDSIPPAIPAIKETDEHAESRIFIGELLFIVLICTTLIPKKTRHFVAMQARNTRLNLSKYLKRLIQRQALP